MIRKGQLIMEGFNAIFFADQFYALAGEIRQACGPDICHYQSVERWVTY